MNFHNVPSPPTGNALARREESLPLGYPYTVTPEMDIESGSASTRALLLKYLGLAFKHKFLIAIIMAITLFYGFINTLMTPKIYSASTTLKIERSVPTILKGGDGQYDGGYDQQFYQTQYEMIRSRQLAERVVTKLNLAQSTFVDGSDNAPVDASVIQARKDMAIGKIVGALQVQPVALSSLVRITFTDLSPVWAQRISIALAEGFEQFTLDRRFEANRYTQSYLEERLQQLKVKLEESEKQLVAYAQQHGIYNSDNKKPVVNADLEGLQQTQAELIKNRLLAEQLWLQASKSDGMSLPQVMSDPVIAQARAALAQLRTTYSQKLTVMKPAFPEMVALRGQMNEIEQQIRSQISVIKASIKSQYDKAIADEQSIRKKTEELKGEALDLRGRSVEYTILLREVDTARNLYEGILQQYKQLGVTSGADVNNVSVVDRALLPVTPDSPSLRKNLLIALVLGLLAASGAVGLLEILDDTLKTPEDVEEVLGLAVLGIGPKFVDPEGRRSVFEVATSEPTSAVAEAYRSLRTSLQFSTQDGAPQSLLITSSRPGEGKSTTALCLAHNFAQLGQKILLIDCDMRNPTMHRLLGLENSAGLSNYLSRNIDAAALVKSSRWEGLSVMTTGPMPPNPAELLSNPRLGVLIQTACEAFDMVIIDGPPVMGLADAPIISSVVAGTLLLVEAGKSKRGVVRNAVKRMHFARARLTGVLLNKFDARARGFSYYGYNQDPYVYSGIGTKTEAKLTHDAHVSESGA